MMLVTKVILQGDGIQAEVLVGTAGTRVLTRLKKRSARVYEAIEVIEAEILMRLREELGLPSVAEVVGEPGLPPLTHEDLRVWDFPANVEETMDPSAAETMGSLVDLLRTLGWHTPCSGFEFSKTTEVE